MTEYEGLHLVQEFGEIMNSGDRVEASREGPGPQISISVNSPGNKIFANGDYIDVHINLNGARRTRGKKEICDLRNAVMNAVDSARNSRE